VRPIGERLLDAFASKGISAKKAIGEALGFKSDKAIYKILNGEQELSFDSLLRFREVTGHSIDWLLTGDGPERAGRAKDADRLNDAKVQAVRSLGAVDLAEIYERLAQDLRAKADAAPPSEASEIENIYWSLPPEDREPLMVKLREAAEMVRRDRETKKASQDRGAAKRRRKVA
jgi:hypothetical protein